MRALYIAAAGVAVCVVVASCAAGSRPTTAVTVTVTQGAIAGPSTGPSTGPTGSASATAEGTASASPGATFPDTTGAYTVTESAGFFTPSGRIDCGINSSWAACTFPEGMNMTGVPSGNTACPDLYPDSDVNGISVGTDVLFACMLDPPGWPIPGSDDAAWSVGRGFPSVTVAGQSFATLPYGQKLRVGPLMCESASHGVTCVNLITRKGFHLALAGVTQVTG